MNLTFSRKTDLALEAIRALSGAPEEKLSRTDLAERIGTTSAYLAQVMPPLVSAGWIESERGPGGGYRLAGSAREARVLEVFEAVEGTASNGRCVLRDGPCPESSCEVHAIWAEARGVLMRGLDELRVLQGER